MKLERILGLVGNPRSPSRTRALVEFALKQCEFNGCPETELIDFAQAPAQHYFEEKVAASNVLVVASPIYKAAVPGFFKSYLDVLPEKAFAGKVALPIMIGAAPNHELALEYSLKPLLTELGAVSVRGVFVMDSLVSKNDFSIHESVQEEIGREVRVAIRFAEVLST